MPAIALPRRPIAAALAVVLALTLSACSQAPEDAAPAPTAAPADAAAAAAQAAEAEAAAAAAAAASTDALAAFSAVELRERGNAALREQRLYSPAGDNAMEYYLALRAKSPTPDVSGESALIDLMPYTLIAAEQAINANDFIEAERLLELMTRTDAEAPSLSRIRDAIAAGRTGLADRERVLEERRLQAEAQRQRDAAAAEQAAAAAAAAAAAPPPAPEPEPTPAPAPVVAAPVQAPVPAPVQVAPAPAPVRSGPPRPISTPQPPYPREAARSRAAGTVVVQYTIGADGRVGNVTILRSRPRDVFDDSVLETVSTWRFEPTGEEVTQTRTFDFRM